MGASQSGPSQSGSSGPQSGFVQESSAQSTKTRAATRINRRGRQPKAQKPELEQESSGQAAQSTSACDMCDWWKRDGKIIYIGRQVDWKQMAKPFIDIKNGEDSTEKAELFIEDKNGRNTPDSTEKAKLFNTLFWVLDFDGIYALKLKVVVEFSAQWSGPSCFIKPFIEKLAVVFKDVLFLRLDYDSMEDAASEVGVDVVPTFLLYKGGKLQNKIVGAGRFELVDNINKFK
ncbi:hypothetical protein V2J09_023775 [Rumex salicifolius]